LAGHCTTAYVRAHEPHCRLLGEPVPAVRAYRQVLRKWPDRQRLDVASDLIPLRMTRLRRDTYA